MSQSIQPIRGLNDVLPENTPYWRHLEECARAVLDTYSYREIRLPIMERTELFSRSIGAATDVVQKEMYTFSDRGGDSVTLRPEATASMVRAGLSNGLLHNQRHRLWCTGPMFRYERPQRGRYRQFHQIDVEAFGFAGPDIDAELILISARLWRLLGLEGLRLEINSLGTPASREIYRAALVEYFEAKRTDLDEDSVKRLTLNPLRILDSKNPAMQALIAAAPAITDFLDAESSAHFADLQAMLSDSGVRYVVNPRLVRGLDYYSRTVFEWLTDDLGAQGAVCSGGRYDGLVAELGGRDTPAIGWALGIERVVELMQAAPVPVEIPTPKVYVVMVGEAANRAGIGLAETLRNALPGVEIQTHCGGGGFKAQLKAADRSGATVAVILGDDETAAREATLKRLREDTPQERYSWQELAARVAPLVS